VLAPRQLGNNCHRKQNPSKKKIKGPGSAWKLPG